VTSDERSMRNDGGARDDFKMLPKPDARQHPALRPAPRVDDKGAEESDFKNWPLVYRAIVEHQRSADWWTNHDDLEMLRQWGGLFIKAFDLRVKDSAYMAMPLIRIEPMNVRTIGIYRPEPDGYAIIGTIALNAERLSALPDFMKLVVLLKLLLCAWQHQSGGDGTFNRECRERMKAMGLVVTEEGAITIDENGPFRRLLAEFGIEVPVASVFPRPCRKGKTTNRLWSCTCQKVRVGTREFFAVCTQCNEPFRLGDYVGKRFVHTGTLAVACRK
jgi:hypothetical protein